MINSGASGNYLSIAIVKELFGIGEIIVPSLGWSSDISSIVQLGMKPVFVDVDPKTLGIKAESLKKAINTKTKAIVVVHALGFNAITNEIKDVLDHEEIFVIEDCCGSHGALINDSKESKIGTYGDLSIFSFYFGHHMTTIEGGMLCTNNNYYQLSRMFRSHGMTREASKKIREKYEKSYPDLNPLFTFGVAGFNFRSSELNAVLGLSQLKKLNKNISNRQKNLNLWLSILNNSEFYTEFNINGNSSFALPIILKNKDVKLKKQVCKTLDDLKVEYRLGTAGGGNLARQPFIKKYKHKIVDDQKNVNHIHDFGLYVGNGSHIDEKSITFVGQELTNL